MSAPATPSSRRPRRVSVTPSTGGGPWAWRARWHAIVVIQRRDLRGLLLAPGGYIALAMGLLAALLVVRNHLDAITRARVLVLSDAFTLPFFGAALVLIFFLALTATTSIAREKEHGTLEVLFYGPVDHASYVLGKHLAQVTAYLVFGAALALLVASYAALSGLRLSSAFPLVLALSIITAASVAAAGICISALMRGVRAALALLAAISLLLEALWLGTNLLSGVAAGPTTSPMLLLRDLVVGLDRVVGLVSPIATFERGIDAAVREDALAYAGTVLLASLHCLVLLLGAIAALRWRGVRR